MVVTEKIRYCSNDAAQSLDHAIDWIKCTRKKEWESLEVQIPIEKFNLVLHSS